MFVLLGVVDDVGFYFGFMFFSFFFMAGICCILLAVVLIALGGLLNC
jgi:hypothetical protein